VTRTSCGSEREGNLKGQRVEGAETGLSDDAIEPLRGSLRGASLRPGDEGYEAARAVWNGMIDRRPELIVRCAGVADVIERP
jgi:hypothetical protein